MLIGERVEDFLQLFRKFLSGTKNVQNILKRLRLIIVKTIKRMLVVRMLEIVVLTLKKTPDQRIHGLLLLVGHCVENLPDGFLFGRIAIRMHNDLKSIVHKGNASFVLDDGLRAIGVGKC